MDFLTTDGCVYDVYLDLNGNPIKRTPSEYPYSYDEYVLYKSPDFKQTDTMVYSDRLLQWNWQAFEKAVSEVWPETPHSQYFSGKKPQDINRFLNLYLGKEVKLTAVLQGCNWGNGYPYWIFAYRDEE